MQRTPREFVINFDKEMRIGIICSTVTKGVRETGTMFPEEEIHMIEYWAYEQAIECLKVCEERLKHELTKG